MKWLIIMRYPVRLPELGAGPVHLTLWFAAPGDAVFAGDRLAEVVVSGASFDVPSPATGRLLERHAWPRDVLITGQVLGVVEGSEGPLA
jgi:pyruvate/2-oxoglutarate dehydrogenase complex dihydrolipoamide acyltransferase (E2) component